MTEDDYCGRQSAGLHFLKCWYLDDLAVGRNGPDSDHLLVYTDARDPSENLINSTHLVNCRAETDLRA